MVSTRTKLDEVGALLDESMGVREAQAATPPRHLSPVADPKDIGRRPIRDVGRLPIGRVIPDPDQPRTEFDEEAIDRLAESIKVKGQLAPIHVRWSTGHTKWVIISGERRWRATRRAGLETIDCRFQTDDMSKSELLEQQLIENLLREDLKPIEQAKGFASLMELNRWSGREVASALHVAPSTVSRALQLLKLPQEIQQQVAEGNIPARTASELSRVDDTAEQHRLAAVAVTGTVSAADAMKLVRQRTGRKARKRQSTKLTFSTEHNWKVVVSAVGSHNYHEVEQALVEVLDEVRLRIKNNVVL